MQLQQVVRKQTKMRMAIEGPSGSGKTYSALLMAYGLCGDWSKIVLIDTQDESASLYSHLGPFNTVQLAAPFHPARYYDLLDLCVTSGKEVIIIDGISEEWNGQGGVIDKLSTRNYEDVLRAHRAFLTALRNCEAHIICMTKTRQKLARIEHEGKWQRRLLQMPMQQSGYEYIFTTVLRLNGDHKARAVKDRTSLFAGKPMFQITPEIGTMIRDWCNLGIPEIPVELQEQINSCKTITELYQVLFKAEIHDVDIMSALVHRWTEIEQDLSTDVKLEPIRGGMRS